MSDILGEDLSDRTSLRDALLERLTAFEGRLNPFEVREFETGLPLPDGSSLKVVVLRGDEGRAPWARVGAVSRHHLEDGPGFDAAAAAAARHGYHVATGDWAAWLPGEVRAESPRRKDLAAAILAVHRGVEIGIEAELEAERGARRREERPAMSASAPAADSATVGADAVAALQEPIEAGQRVPEDPAAELNHVLERFTARVIAERRSWAEDRRADMRVMAISFLAYLVAASIAALMIGWLAAAWPIHPEPGPAAPIPPAGAAARPDGRSP